MNVRGTMGTLYLQSSEVVFCDALSSYKFGATAYKTMTYNKFRKLVL